MTRKSNPRQASGKRTPRSKFSRSKKNNKGHLHLHSSSYSSDPSEYESSKSYSSSTSESESSSSSAPRPFSIRPPSRPSPKRRQFQINTSTNDSVATPQDLLDQLDAEFHFSPFDPCPLNPKPAFDGLGLSWHKTTFVNPPYSDVRPWIE